MAFENFVSWLATFRNQRTLAHNASIFFGVLLLTTGMLCFVTSGMDTHPDEDELWEDHHKAVTAWGAAGAGAFGAWGSFYLHKTFQTIEREDEEQMRANNTIITIIGLVFQLIMVICTIVVDIAGVKNGFGGLVAVSILYLLVLVATMSYDVINLVQPGRIILLGDEYGSSS